ncbi:MAG TPA: Gfo/Idh/MocA family oxidoreductase [Flavisolibacter sp.]|jgi:predicted dehydrogenase
MNRFAIIGCGDAGTRHAERLEVTGRVVVACDTDAARADHLAQQHRAEAWYSVDDLLHTGEEFDVAVICTPNGTHAEHVIKMLQAGKHVACEQPLCLTSAAAWQMVETEKFTRRKLHLVPQWEAAGVDALAAAVISACGAIKSFSVKAVRPAGTGKEWKKKSFPGGGLLYSDFFDVMELLYRLLGEAVSGSGVAQRIAGEDAEESGSASLQMKSGARGSLQWSLSAEESPLVQVELNGENGSIGITGEQDSWRVMQGGNVLLSVTGREEEQYRKFYRELAASLEQNATSNLFEGLPVVEFTERVYKAITFTTPASS